MNRTDMFLVIGVVLGLVALGFIGKGAYDRYKERNEVPPNIKTGGYTPATTPGDVAQKSQVIVRYTK